MLHLDEHQLHPRQDFRSGEPSPWPINACSPEFTGKYLGVPRVTQALARDHHPMFATEFMALQ